MCGCLFVRRCQCVWQCVMYQCLRQMSVQVFAIVRNCVCKFVQMYLCKFMCHSVWVVCLCHCVCVCLCVWVCVCHCVCALLGVGVCVIKCVWCVCHSVRLCVCH